ncbi:MAG: 3'(2'),5'-bisphosphate nucleotidase CysQ [Proteobacteria bacterium]|nr:3'(2'),5'-bisphosphate nucleotidase CysQ [Pseudomonadota bacterium]MDA0896484.1 3'(2'),5'-bisphosphate nucleotidase CysQ [Pseudomonadota bacterium]MDA1243925.1 3'(2'),5'-bisphosphate nucleotidase CysQ [Pseudomonadota bacterium]
MSQADISKHTLDEMCRIAEAASSEILTVYNSAADIEIEHKADDSPLTLADRRAHELIERELLSFAPGIPVLSEESLQLPFAERQTWSRYWLVDPLDGTKEFIGRNGEFTVNIALIDNGVARLGVVSVPVTGVTYSGINDDQTPCAWKKESSGARPITVAAMAGQKIRVVASRRHRGERLEEMLATIDKALGIGEVVSIGSSLKMCLVAEGAADIYPRLAPTSEWDTAAAQAILAAAGGEIVDLDFTPLRYNQKESLLNPEFIALGDRAYAWQALLR